MSVQAEYRQEGREVKKQGTLLGRVKVWTVRNFCACHENPWEIPLSRRRSSTTSASSALVIVLGVRQSEKKKSQRSVRDQGGDPIVSMDDKSFGEAATQEETMTHGVATYVCVQSQHLCSSECVTISNCLATLEIASAVRDQGETGAFVQMLGK